MQTTPQHHLPEWIQEYERRYRQTYMDLLNTSIRRQQQHEDALKALQSAVDITGAITLDFVEHHMKTTKKALAQKRF